MVCESRRSSYLRASLVHFHRFPSSFTHSNHPPVPFIASCEPLQSLEQIKATIFPFCPVDFSYGTTEKEETTWCVDNSKLGNCHVLLVFSRKQRHVVEIGKSPGGRKSAPNDGAYFWWVGTKKVGMGGRSFVPVLGFCDLCLRNTLIGVGVRCEIGLRGTASRQERGNPDESGLEGMVFTCSINVLR